MKRAIGSILLILAFTLLLTAYGFSWGSATHAFIAKKIGRLSMFFNSQEIYGLMAPDLFNYNFELANDPILIAFTHGVPGNEGFMAVWEKAQWRDYQKSLAFGFVAHNDVWGADYTAHHQALTLSAPADFPQGIDPGYVIIKALALNSDPTMNSYFEALGLSNSDPQQFGLRLEMCHNLVETAGDLIIRRVDPGIGEKIISAAVLRSRSFPELLIKALNNPDYNQIIRQNEAQFRRLMIQYGAILAQPEARAFEGLAEQMAELGVAFIKQFAGIDIPLDQALEISKYGIKKSIELCAPDYLNEIRKTIGYLRVELQNHNVHY
ncbi:MAG: hypothetical protein ACPLRA_06385 [Candidatus Saccharicenans sp.]